MCLSFLSNQQSDHLGVGCHGNPIDSTLTRPTDSNRTFDIFSPEFIGDFIGSIIERINKLGSSLEHKQSSLKPFSTSAVKYGNLPLVPYSGIVSSIGPIEGLFRLDWCSLCVNWIPHPRSQTHLWSFSILLTIIYTVGTTWLNDLIVAGAIDPK